MTVFLSVFWFFVDISAYLKMVRATGPCFSLDARKCLGGILEYRRSKGVAIVSRKHKPGGRAPFVLNYYGYQNRIYISEAVRHWHLLSEAERGEWDDYIN